MKVTVLTCVLSERIKRRAPSTQADSVRDWRRKPVGGRRGGGGGEERKAEDWKDSQKRRLTIFPFSRLNLIYMYFISPFSVCTPATFVNFLTI